MYVVERVLTFIAINVCVLVSDYLILLIVAGFCMGGIFMIKLYYTAITMKEYLDKKKEETGNAIEVE